MIDLHEDITAYLDRHQNKELLRFLTCGSVDDGKSTLIGRLLHDTKMIYEDQLAAIKKDSVKHGTTGAGEVDLALLTDGLKAEREQGITIDVAYRYFSTDKRKFIIADTPGHEQYTRNMATGASTCQLAIILIDARHGVMTQTRRHSFIVSLLGIKHIVVAINKMDIAGFSQETFDRIKAEYEIFAAKLGLKNIMFIPMSALKGDNVVDKSPSMPWYTGPALLDHLETVPLAADDASQPMRFPVQYVIRPNLNFRGFAGTLASGVLRTGDAVMALPSGKKSTVKSIVTFDGELTQAFSPQAINVTLADEIDVSRGDMLVHAAAAPFLAREFEAMVVWMNEHAFVPGKSYWIKQTTRTVTGEIAELRYGVDVNTLEHRTVLRLGLNEVGRVLLRTSQPLAFDPYAQNPCTGSFIVIDRLSNNTIGAGMIIGPRQRAEQSRGPVTTHEKEIKLGQHGAILWMTPDIADLLERHLFDEGRTVLRWDAPAAAAVGTRDLLTLASSAGQQGLLVIITSPIAPPPGNGPTGPTPLIELAGRDLDSALDQLRVHNIIGPDQATHGEGI